MNNLCTILIVIYSLALVASVYSDDCWWTGCQLESWKDKGCDQYGRREDGRRGCNGGNEYHCCPKVNGGGGNAGLITQEQFNRACQTKPGGMGSSEDYQLFIKSFHRAQISDKSEAAKYLAHTVWETSGMSQWREELCQNQNNLQRCREAYGTGPNGVIYYGKGPLQLSHPYNYKAASASLYNDESFLFNNPDKVADNRQTGWDTASYFWSANVHSRSSTFGSTLKAINGAQECSGGPNQENLWKRCEDYRQILGILGMGLPDRHSDCIC